MAYSYVHMSKLWADELIRLQDKGEAATGMLWYSQGRRRTGVIRALLAGAEGPEFKTWVVHGIVT